MSKRTSIVKALTEKFKEIDGTGKYTSNIYNNAFPILKFWDEVNDYPCIYSSPGTELREYNGCYTWAFLNVLIKVYTKGDNAQDELEKLLEDIETCINDNRVLQFEPGMQTVEILVQSIVTDEGLLAPYAVGEITVEVRYQKPIV